MACPAARGCDGSKQFDHSSLIGPGLPWFGSQWRCRENWNWPSSCRSAIAGSN